MWKRYGRLRPSPSAGAKSFATKHGAAAGDPLSPIFLSMFPSSQWESPSRTTGRSLFFWIFLSAMGHTPHTSGLLPSIHLSPASRGVFARGGLRPRECENTSWFCLTVAPSEGGALILHGGLCSSASIFLPTSAVSPKVAPQCQRC